MRTGDRSCTCTYITVSVCVDSNDSPYSQQTFHGKAMTSGTKYDTITVKMQVKETK